MIERNFVVINDPDANYWQGAIIERNTAHVLERRGVIMLPCEPELISKGALGGFYFRSWGSGYPLQTSQSMGCPMAIYCEPQYTKLHWKACIIVPEKTRAEGLTGTLALANDNTQQGIVCGGIVGPMGVDSVIDLSRLKEPDKNGAHIIGATISASCDRPGIHALCLYGYGRGARVAWVAITQT